MKNRITLLAALVLISCAFAFSADMVVNNGYDPGAMRKDGTNADSPVFPGAVTVNGAFVASDGAEFRGTASAVKILGNPTLAPTTCIDGKVGLDLWANTFFLGADNGANTRTNSTDKWAAIVAPSVTSTEQPVALLSYRADAGGSYQKLIIGGEDAGYTSVARNACTILDFNTAATRTTLRGERAMRINSSQQILIATTTAAINSAVKLKLNGGMEIAPGGFLLVGTDTREVGYGATIASGAYVLGDVSADQFTDRSDAPESLAEAYAIIQSHEVKDGKVDHSKLHSAAWGRKYRLVSTGKPVVKWRDVEQENSKGEKISVPESYEEPEILTVSEPDKQGRNLSMVISAQALVIADLTKRLEALEAK
jgi:hypothetical protein